MKMSVLIAVTMPVMLMPFATTTLGHMPAYAKKATQEMALIAPVRFYWQMYIPAVVNGQCSEDSSIYDPSKLLFDIMCYPINICFL